MASDKLVSIPGYTVHRLLGEGGMAKVYLATQNSLQREVAIKVLINPSDEQFAKRFMAEARTIAALNHSRVITIFDVAQLDDGCLYFVMEYLEGGDLSQYKGQAVDAEVALVFIRQIAEALQFIHSNNIIHRDIKPANILFKSSESLVLSDFGIAKNEQQDGDLTLSGYSVGSPSYGSPEQTLEKPIDSRTDIYSLGVVWMELLLGCNPYLGESITESAVNHLQMDIPRLPSNLKEYQSTLDRMLAKDPEDRFEDAKALIANIDSVIASSTPQGEFTFDKNSVGLGARLSFAKNAAYSFVALMCFLAVVFFFTHESERDKKIKQLLLSAKLSQREARFEAPEQNNAQYFYQEVLLLDAGNESALLGLKNLQQVQVQYYLKKANECVEAQELSSPKHRNAIFYYNQVLSLEPENEHANEGLKLLASQYLEMSQTAFLEENYRLGFQHLKQGLELDPSNEALILLREEHRHQSNAFKRLFNRVFK